MACACLLTAASHPCLRVWTTDRVAEAFEVRAKPVANWLGMAFFASLGFHIPLHEMLSWKLFGFGVVMTVRLHIISATCIV